VQKKHRIAFLAIFCYNRGMKKQYLLAIIFVLVLGAGIGLGYFIKSQMTNPRATIPGVFSRVLTFLVQTGEIADEDVLYHDVDLADFIVNGSDKTKVAVEGIVDKVTDEPDGDNHIVLRAPNVPLLFLVTETIPEIKLPLPKVGDRIKIWGITRFDILHNWWELHPVIGWQKK
jgi:hypothetical protein